MKKNIFLLLIIVIITLSSCAMSPVRKVLERDNLALNITLGGAVVDQVQGISFLPLPANLSLGVTYGLTDKLTVGMNLYPVALLGGNLIIEPLGVYNFYKQENYIPNLNGAFSLPASFSFTGKGVGFYPTLSFAPAYENDTGLVYTAVDFLFDSTRLKPSWSWKLGGEWKTWEQVSLGMELGLVNIGEESMVSPLSRSGIGIPEFTLGSSIILYKP